MGEPITVVVSAGHIYFGIGFLVGIVAGWFAGGYYKVRRQTMSKDEVVDEAKALTEAKFVAGFKVIMNEIEKLKAK